MSEPIRNDQGQIAVKYIKAIPKYVRLGNGHEYAFGVRMNISMSWVNEEDIPPLFNMLEGCCGQRRHQVFIPASELDVQRWTS